MKYLFYISLYLLCCSFIDPALKVYVDRFYRECDIRGYKYTSKIDRIKFPSFKEDSIFQITKIKPDWTGVDIKRNDSVNFIFINATRFYYTDSIVREMVVFHELFHAVFNVNHCEFDDIGIMNEIITKNEAVYYMLHRDEILNKTFNLISK